MPKLEYLINILLITLIFLTFASAIRTALKSEARNQKTFTTTNYNRFDF